MIILSPFRILAGLLLALPGLAQEPEAHTLFDDEPVSDSRDWPDVPEVQLTWDARGPKKAKSWMLAAPEWDNDKQSRSARITRRVDDMGFIVWLEQFQGVDATRVTVAAINGFANAGPRYFEGYTIEVNGRSLESIEGRHVVLPRGALIRRFTVGREQVLLREWSYIEENKPVPAWADDAARKDTAKRKAFPFRDQDGRAIELGPYNFFWRNESLNDSHGGWGVGPFHGGPEDWLQSEAGRQNRETEMLLAFQRPIWMLAEDFSPLTLQVAYWMGRTRAHQPDEFQYELDDWCTYAERLSDFQFADHTHLSRGTSGAAAVAPWDRFAVACLEAVLTDFKMAQSMTRFVGKDANGKPIRHPGARQGNSLLWPLWLKIEALDGPQNGAGDRGLAHWLRLLRWCRPYFPEKELAPFSEGLRQLVRTLADDYGITGAGNAPEFASVPGGALSKALKLPYAYTFHQQLVAYECQRFGGISDIGEKAARFMGPHPPKIFEVRAGKPNDRVAHRNHSADKDQENKMWSYRAYGNMTHDILSDFEDPAAFLRSMQQAGINGASQNLDCTPRHIWEPGL